MLFLEHFRSEELFIGLIEKSRLASVLSGVMKMIVDFYSIQEHTKKASKLKLEIELLEKHKAFLLTSNADIRKSLYIDAKEFVEPSKKKGQFEGGLSHRSGPSAQFLDPNDAGDKDIIRNIVSPRTDSHNYELVYKTEARKAGHTGENDLAFKSHTSFKKPLPSYDIARLQRVAEEAEVSSKNRQDYIKLPKTYR